MLHRSYLHTAVNFMQKRESISSLGTTYSIGGRFCVEQTQRKNVFKQSVVRLVCVCFVLIVLFIFY